MKPYRELTLADDFMFGYVMRQEKIAKPFLEGLLQCKIDHLVYTDVQHDLKPGYMSHGIRMDVYLLDDAHTVYDIEMQNTIPDDLEKRIRYYQSGIDRYQLRVNENYGELRNSVIIFIMTSDYYNKGYPVYRKKSFIFAEKQEVSEYHDGTEVFILNSSSPKISDMTGNAADFLAYLNAVHKHQAIPESIRNSVYITEIEKTISDAKRNEIEEASYMHLSVKIEDEKKKARIEGLAEGRAEGLAEGLAEGRAEGRAEARAEVLTEMAIGLYKVGLPITQISELCKLEVEAVKEIIDSAVV